MGTRPRAVGCDPVASSASPCPAARPATSRRSSRSSAPASSGVSTTVVVISTNDSKSSGLIRSVASPNTREKPSRAGSSVSASTSISSSSIPSDHAGAEPKRLRSTGLLAADAVHRPPGSLPGVVRGARTEVALVVDDPRVAADLHRTLRVAEEVRVVLLLPDEHEVRRSHEDRDEIAAGRRTRERVGAHAEPADVLGAVLRPELLGLLGNAVLHEPASARVDLPTLHRAKVATACYLRRSKAQTPPTTAVPTVIQAT